MGRYRKKVSFVGSAASGKTAILSTLLQNTFDEAYTPTVFDNSCVTVQTDGHTVELALWDTAGSSDFDHLRPLAYADVDVVVVCFAVNDKVSFESVEAKWYQDAARSAPQCSLLLVGCKKDLGYADELGNLDASGSLTVAHHEGLSAAAKLGFAGYHECSAKTHEGITEIFDSVARLAIRSDTTKARKSTGVLRKKFRKQPSPRSETKGVQKLKRSSPVQSPKIRARSLSHDGFRSSASPPSSPRSVSQTLDEDYFFKRDFIIVEESPITTEPADLAALLDAPVVQDGLTVQRDTVLSQIEDAFGSRLPSSRKSYWKRIRQHIKIYPYSIHYVSQFLQYVSVFSLRPELREIGESRLAGFLEVIQDWSKLTPIMAAVEQGSVRASLMEAYACAQEIADAGLLEDMGVNTGAWLEVIGFILECDMQDLEQTLVDIFYDPGAVLHSILETLLSPQIAALVNLLEMLIDRRMRLQRRLELILRSIVKVTGQIPSNIILPDVQRSGLNPVAGGGFADVWKGSLNGTKVALKVVRIFGDATAREKTQIDFILEALIWRRLRHENVLPFYGVSIEEFRPQIALVSPWMQYGDLALYLKRHKNTDRIKMVLGVARGLYYLHALNPVVVHGDLRANNILVDGGSNPRIADFGLARIVDSNSTTIGATTFHGRGSMRWQSPELLDSTRFTGIPSGFTTMSDVYAFASVCLEIFTDDIPFSGLRDGEVIIEVVIRHGRPPHPGSSAAAAGLDDQTWRLVQDCWETDPRNRPPMEEVLRRLVDKET